ncbi:unnamed protein product [Schistosoma margrebowiei]|uniref:Trematode PH-like domain-containing protein n=1 Tax=Schistosoma margrebowiei TaxID=48269 RepID=A0A183M1H9_9TREM|nr:unnamed protein product [Schistosoma margrebowiei]
MSNNRSKSLSLPHICNYGELNTYSLNQLKLDKKTKQSVYYICHICILKSKQINNNDELTKDKAEYLIHSNLNKRLAHCNLYCLQDQIRFEKSKQCSLNPPRKFILYKHIKYIYISEKKPYIFILCIEYDQVKYKIYEVYKCKLSQDVKMIYSLLQKALNDKEYLLRDEFKYPKISIGLQCCLIYDKTMNTTNNIMNLSTYENNIHNNNETYMNHIKRQSLLSMNRSLTRNKFTGVTTNIYEEHSNELIQKQPITSTSSSRYSNISMELLQKLNRAYNPDGEYNNNTWHKSLILLQTDYIRGPRINDIGPIYMFVARQLK